MGSDNPKGAVAPLSAPARYGRYAAIACVCVVLLVTLLTNPHIDPKRVPLAPRRAGASEGRQGALASMQGVSSAVGDLKSKLKNAAVELGDVGALHETTMPRKRPEVPLHAKNAARVLERANYEEVGAKVAFAEDEGLENTEIGTEGIAETDDERDDGVGDEESGGGDDDDDDDDDDDGDDDGDERGDEAKPEGLYTLAALDMRGEDVDLSYAAGKVSLVTNVASE